MSGNQADLKQLRHDVALANRIIERFGLSGAFGHASARIPGTNTFLLPTRRSPGLAHEDTLLVLDTDVRKHAGDGEPNSEFWIHARIYAARPDVGGFRVGGFGFHQGLPGCQGSDPSVNPLPIASGELA